MSIIKYQERHLQTFNWSITLLLAVSWQIQLIHLGTLVLVGYIWVQNEFVLMSFHLNYFTNYTIFDLSLLVYLGSTLIPSLTISTWNSGKKSSSSRPSLAGSMMVLAFRDDPCGHGWVVSDRIPSSFQGPNSWGVVQILYDYPRNELNILIQIYSECGSQECVWSMRCQWYNAKTWCFIKSKATLHQNHQPSSDRRPICFFAARMCIIMFQHGSNCWTLEIPGLVMTFTVCHG